MYIAFKPVILSMSSWVTFHPQGFKYRHVGDKSSHALLSVWKSFIRWFVDKGWIWQNPITAKPWELFFLWLTESSRGQHLKWVLWNSPLEDLLDAQSLTRSVRDKKMQQCAKYVTSPCWGLALIQSIKSLLALH